MSAVYAMQGMHELFRPLCEDRTGVAGCRTCDKVRAKYLYMFCCTVLWYFVRYNRVTGS